MDDAKKCSVDDCNNTAKRRSLCHGHYARFRKHGDPQSGGPMKPRVLGRTCCAVEKCCQPHTAKGYCGKHYNHLLKHGDPVVRPPRKTRRDARKPCSIEGCEQISVGKGYCDKHYTRFKRHDDPMGGRHEAEALELIRQVVIDPPEACVLWPLRRAEYGYGNTYYQGATITAHRLARMLYDRITERPPRLVVARHLCDGGKDGCYNPLHIAWGTHQQNRDDAVRAGMIPNGENHHKAKLTEGDVRLIRSLSRPYGEIAELFHVNPTTIGYIKRRQTWKHI